MAEPTDPTLIPRAPDEWRRPSGERVDGEAVALLVNGRRFEGWREVSVQRSLGALAGTFQVSAFDRPAWPIRRGDRVQMMAGRDQVLDGWVGKVALTLDGRLTVSGSERTSDLARQSWIGEPEWFGITLRQLVRRLTEPLGIVVRVEAAATSSLDEPFPVWSTQPGETHWAILERALRLRALVARTNARGELVLGDGRGRAGAGSLVQGQNVFRGSYAEDETDRFRRYVVRAQQSGAGFTGLVDPVALLSQAEARDEGARGLALLVNADSAATKADCQARANWEATVRAARGSSLGVEVRGWRQSPGGPLWEPGVLVPVVLPRLRVRGTWIVESVTLSQGNGGETVELGLRRPDAYAPSPSPPKSADPATGWDALLAAEGADG